MKSPAQQKIIQIDITNACPHKCSHCTRFTSHIAKPCFMDGATFRKAVVSLESFPGMVGIMGGEPTIHPEFARFVEFYAEHIGTGRLDWGRRPIADFAAYRNRQLANVKHRRGLWTSLGPAYYKHFELIQEVFPYQCINDHTNPGQHQALLITRKELGIADDQWHVLRDACWVQDLWSASITPKGAFFCEVAGALDMLYDGPGGWPIEPGWWQRTPDQFGDQLRWCELCSAPLAVPRVQANVEVDIVSPAHLERLAAIGAPSVKSPGRIKVFDCGGYDPKRYDQKASAEWYLPDGDNRQRVASTNLSIRPRKLDGLCVCVGFGAVLRHTLAANIEHFDRFAVVTSSDDTLTQSVAKQFPVKVLLVVSDAYKTNGDAFNKGRMLNAGWSALAPTDWVLCTDADIFLPSNLRPWLNSHVLNPGCLHYTRRLHLRDRADVQRYASTRDAKLLRPFNDIGTNYQAWGYFQLLNVRAQALEGTPKDKPFSEAFCGAGSIDGNFRMRWPWGKHVRLEGLDVVHVPHSSRFAADWNGPGRGNTHGWRWAGQFSPGRGSVLRIPAGGFVRLTRADTAESIAGPGERFIAAAPNVRTAIGFPGYGFAVVGGRQVAVWAGREIHRVGMEIAWRADLEGYEGPRL